MIIVGEKINSTLSGVKDAVQNRDVEFVQNLATLQANNGADYIDVNCGTLMDGEEEGLAWLVTTVQEAVAKPCCIDSPNPNAVAAALKVHKGKALINSINAEEERYNAILPLVKEYGAGVIALVQDDEHGMPKSAVTRVEIGKKLIDRLGKDGVPQQDIYIDPLIQPISVSAELALAAMETVRGIKEAYPEVHFMCGLSNVSYGLPKRAIINGTFMTLLMQAGLDGAILDPGNKRLMSAVYTTEALLTKDAHLKNYLKAFRKGLLDF